MYPGHAVSHGNRNPTPNLQQILLLNFSLILKNTPKRGFLLIYTDQAKFLPWPIRGLSGFCEWASSTLRYLTGGFVKQDSVTATVGFQVDTSLVSDLCHCAL